ncbi:hypothetical protein A2U01_0054588, partial [Trifolium medium]|nr:hypothetical protein [Trifolium medium]
MTEQFLSREEAEARRIMGIQQELGIRFHGSEDADLKRAMDLE